MKTIDPSDISSTYAHLDENDRVGLLPVTETFWHDLTSGAYPQLARGRLMSAFTFSEAWKVWERHPAGEEIVMLLSGSARFTLALSEDRHEVLLDRIGAYIAIPPGVWHTASTDNTATVLFITPGAGTEHRAA